jgi:hypothetical protein
MLQAFDAPLRLVMPDLAGSAASALDASAGVAAARARR